MLPRCKLVRCAIRSWVACSMTKSFRAMLSDNSKRMVSSATTFPCRTTSAARSAMQCMTVVLRSGTEYILDVLFSVVAKLTYSVMYELKSEGISFRTGSSIIRSRLCKEQYRISIFHSFSFVISF